MTDDLYTSINILLSVLCHFVGRTFFVIKLLEPDGVAQFISDL